VESYTAENVSLQLTQGSLTLHTAQAHGEVSVAGHSIDVDSYTEVAVTKNTKESKVDCLSGGITLHGGKHLSGGQSNSI
jgi:hypothetical protein